MKTKTRHLGPFLVLLLLLVLLQPVDAQLEWLWTMVDDFVRLVFLLPLFNLFYDNCNLDHCFHGVCEDAINSYNCICDAGWDGMACDQQIDDCTADLNPCSIVTTKRGFV